jgi:hypothetical protein
MKSEFILTTPKLKTAIEEWQKSNVPLTELIPLMRFASIHEVQYGSEISILEPFNLDFQHKATFSVGEAPSDHQCGGISASFEFEPPAPAPRESQTQIKDEPLPPLLAEQRDRLETEFESALIDIANDWEKRVSGLDLVIQGFLRHNDMVARVDEGTSEEAALVLELHHNLRSALLA